MGDAFRKVRSGEPLAIPANTFNAFIDAAIAHRQQQNVGGGRLPAYRQASIVLVRNDSEADVGQFGVLGISGVVFDPATALEGFQGRVALTGVTPFAGTHEGRFVIAAEPIRSGEIGSAYADGVCQVQVNVTDASHDYAEIADGDAAKLASGVAGTAYIIWKEAGIGVKWSIVRFGFSIIPHAENCV